MSSFIVSQKTMNRVMSYIRRHATDEIKELDYDPNVFESMVKLNSALVALNHQAVDIRYKGDKNKFNPQKATEFVSIEVSDAQAFYSLCCLIYQCTEGDIPDTSELYQMLSEIRDELAKTIAYKVADSEHAEWD